MSKLRLTLSSNDFAKLLSELVPPEFHLPPRTLPTTREALRKLLHYHLTDGETIAVSVRFTAKYVLMLWSKANIPAMELCNIVVILSKLHAEFLLVKKNQKRCGAAQKAREDAFMKKLAPLFDIGYADQVKIAEDMKFLEDQRTR